MKEPAESLGVDAPSSACATAGPGAALAGGPSTRRIHLWGARFAGVMFAVFGSAGASFLCQFLLVRKLSVADCGTILTALSVANFLQPIAHMGAPIFLAQLRSSDAPAPLWIRAGAPYLAVSGVFCCVVAILYWMRAGSAATLGTSDLALFLPLVLVFPIVELWASRYQLERRLVAFAVLQIAIQAPRLLGLGAALQLRIRLNLHFVLLLYSGLAAVACIVGLVGLMVWAMSRVAGVKPKGWRLVWSGSPYAGLALMSIGLSQISVMLLYALGSPALAAQVSAANLFTTAVGLLPIVLYNQLLLPWAAEWSKTDGRRHAALLHVGLPGMALVGLAFALILVSSRWFIVNHILGPGYATVAAILNVSAFALPFRFASFALSAALFLRENIRQKLLIHAISGSVFLVLLVALFPSMVAIAPAVSAIVSEIVLLLLHIRATQKAVPQLNWGLALRPAAFWEQLNLVVGRSTSASRT